MLVELKWLPGLERVQVCLVRLFDFGPNPGVESEKAQKKSDSHGDDQRRIGLEVGTGDHAADHTDDGATNKYFEK